VSTIQDVARLAGVSNSTVSNVLNRRTDRMAKGTLARVEAAIAQLGFRPSHAARFLKTGHAPLIGFLVPSIANPSYGVLAREVEIAAQERYGYRVLLGNTCRSRDKEAEFLDDLLSHGARGAIVISSLPDESHFEAAAERGLVAVSYDRQATPGSSSVVDHVSVDNFASGRIAARHLIENGHRRIAFLTSSGRTLSRVAKSEGFLAAAREAGVVDGCVVEGAAQSAFGDGEMTELGWALGRKLARESNRPTGLAAVNDMFAIGVIAGLREHGLSVPADISVIGSDDLFLAPRLNPPLTSVRLPFAEMARRMVERVVARISDPGIPAHEFLFQPTLVSRQSVARPPSTTQKRPAATRMRAP
jgi:DNA-binding LacI/PurR family transcriptional regulator